MSDNLLHVGVALAQIPDGGWHGSLPVRAQQLVVELPSCQQRGTGHEPRRQPAVAPFLHGPPHSTAP